MLTKDKALKIWDCMENNDGWAKHPSKWLEKFSIDEDDFDELCDFIFYAIEGATYLTNDFLELTTGERIANNHLADMNIYFDQDYANKRPPLLRITLKIEENAGENFDRVIAANRKAVAEAEEEN